MIMLSLLQHGLECCPQRSTPVASPPANTNSSYLDVPPLLTPKLVAIFAATRQKCSPYFPVFSPAYCIALSLLPFKFLHSFFPPFLLLAPTFI